MEMADVILILAPGQGDKLDDEMIALVFAATNIERPAAGVVMCTVPAAQVHQLEKNPRVAYVRRVQGYVGSFDS